MITDKARTPVVMTVLILKRPNMTHPPKGKTRAGA
jgi:hypothetical protein